MTTRRSIAGWVTGLLLVAAAGAWIAWRPDTPPTADLLTATAQATRPNPPLGKARTVHPAAADNPTVPEGMTPAQWQSLREQLRNHPQREAEIARISAAVTYLSRLEHYRALGSSTTENSPQASRELAIWLLDQLPARIANKEVSGQEGRRLQAALLDTLGATQAERDAAQQRLADAVPIDASLQARAGLDARYQRDAAALLATWQAQPAAQRDAQQLEASLGALRRSVFSNPASADASAGALR